MLSLAIDQHRQQLTVNLRDEQGDVILKRQVSTEWTRVRTFFEEVRSRSLPEGGFVAIVEVCGFHDWLLKLLAEYGCREIVLIQPEKRSKNKSDRRRGLDAARERHVGIVYIPPGLASTRELGQCAGPTARRNHDSFSGGVALTKRLRLSATGFASAFWAG